MEVTASREGVVAARGLNEVENDAREGKVMVILVWVGVRFGWM